MRTGTVAEKSYEEAHSETRTHDVYKYDCGYYKKSAIDITKKYGCGMGYFEEDYEAAIRECRLITLKGEEDRQDTWCVSTGAWEGLQLGDDYTVPEDAYRPGTEESA